MPIRARLALAFASAILVVVAVGGVLFERSFANGVRSSLDPGLRAKAATPAAAFDGQARPGAGRPRVVHERDDVAQLFDRDGRLLATTSEAGTRPVVDPSVVLEARHEHRFVDVAVGREGEPYRVFVRPDRSGRIVLVSTSLEPTNAAIARVRSALLVGGVIAVLVAGLGGWLLAGAALRPVERMRRTAAEISEHDLAARLPVPRTHDELQALATTMNRLLAELEELVRRQQAFVADAGHELRTPLAVLRTELELAGRPNRTRDELRDAVAHAAEETDRLEQLVEGLLFLARQDGATAARSEPTALTPVLESAVEAERPRARRHGVAIDLDADPTVTACVVLPLLRPAVDNLLRNAVRYAPPGSAITVRLRGADASAVVEVLDEGPGFPPEFLPLAFERFTRGDPSRTGEDHAGLGLAIVRTVADAHHGTAVAANRASGGAVVTIRIPRTL